MPSGHEKAHVAAGNGRRRFRRVGGLRKSVRQVNGRPQPTVRRARRGRRQTAELTVLTWMSNVGQRSNEMMMTTMKTTAAAEDRTTGRVNEKN